MGWCPWTSLKANYANTKTDQYKDALGDVFLRSIGKIPGGVLVFFLHMV